VGFLIGPAMSGYLSQFGYQYPAYAAASLSFLSILGTTFLLPKTAQEKPAKGAHGKVSLLQWSHYTKFFREPKLAALLAQFFLFSIAFSMYISGFALFSERRFEAGGHPFGPKEVGYVMAYSGMLGIIIQGGLLGRLVKKFGERHLVTAGFALMAFGYITTGFAHSVLFLLVIMTFSSFGNGFLRPALTSLVTQNAGRAEQGTVLGLTQTLMSVAQIVGPMVAGMLIDARWLEAWAATAGSAAFIGMFLSRRSMLKEREVHSIQNVRA
jgi:MFS family permease